MDSRANTNLTADLLSPDVILCCGEDEAALLHTIPPRFSSPAQRKLAFRFYRFWKFADHTLILSGIGTGCLEPLLYELFSFNIVRRIILIGTAGRINGATAAQIGKVYAIGEASLACTGLDAIAREGTFTPTLRAAPELPTVTIVSTDLYYGFSNTADPRYTAHFSPGASLWERTRGRDLVDMEVGQFYALCSYLDSTTNHVEYLAIKGPANKMGSPQGQNQNTSQVLAAVESAYAILGVRPREVRPTATPGNRVDAARNSDGSSAG